MPKPPITLITSDEFNDLNKNKTLHLVQRHVEEKADGSKVTVERSLEHSDQSYCQGSQWIIPKNPDWSGKQSNPFEKHLRDDKTSTVIRETTIIEDGKGNKIIDEKAIKQEDFDIRNGTKSISPRPELNRDSRQGMLEHFKTGKDPFSILGHGKDFKPLIEGDK
jgi:hypothetical protein